MRMRTDSSNFSRTLRQGFRVREAGCRLGGRNRRLPVATLSDGARAHRSASSGRKFPDRAIGGQRIRNVGELEVEPQRLRVGLQRNAGLRAGRTSRCRNRFPSGSTA